MRCCGGTQGSRSTLHIISPKPPCEPPRLWRKEIYDSTRAYEKTHVSVVIEKHIKGVQRVEKRRLTLNGGNRPILLLFLSPTEQTGGRNVQKGQTNSSPSGRGDCALAAHGGRDFP